MIEQWQELRETITELRDNDGTGTQQEVCKFLINLMDILEKQMQEPCEDCVSRIEALNSLDKVENKDSWYRLTDVMKMIRNLPPINPQPKTGHWIPVSERLPKPKETEDLIAKYYLVQNEYGDMMVARWDGKGWEQMYQYEYLEDDVIAWMPLPKPYK